MPPSSSDNRVWPWEAAAVAFAVASTLALGLANLGAPSYWHDELVHVYVARHVLDNGVPALPSGEPYPSGAAYAYLLAGWVAAFGGGEFATRSLSVVVAALAVALTWRLTRRLLGVAPAAVTAVLLAWSPWEVAWAREARFYTMQQALYVAFLALAWSAFDRPGRRAARNAGAAAGAYLAGMLTSLHSILFLTPLGAFAFLAGLRDERRKLPLLTAAACAGAAGLLGMTQRFGLLAAFTLVACAVAAVLLARGWRPGRWTAACALTALAIALTFLALHAALPAKDHDSIFKSGGLTGINEPQRGDTDRATPLYYLRFLWQNLSLGYFLLALAGFAWMLAREGRRGFYAALAFCLPLALLTYIGYRRDRFLFFAYPFYAAACGYGLVRLAEVFGGAFRRDRRSAPRIALAVLVAVFGLRLAVSTVLLAGDSIVAASGVSSTLARQHPQWRAPGEWVRAHARPSDAIAGTTYLPVMHYAGRCDAVYPTRVAPWEYPEYSVEGLVDLGALRTFVREHPSGYFLAHYRRWQYVLWLVQKDYDWVEANMRRVDAASNDDITVYAWGEAASGADGSETR